MFFGKFMDTETLIFQQGLHTIRDYIRWGSSRMNEAGVYFGHGTDNAFDEAAALVLHALHLPPDTHESYFQARLLPTEKEAVIALLLRRIQERKPAAYLIHKAWFMGLPFYIDERVLVPRSPLAELIAAQFQPWLKESDGLERILDLCTGSGCIGIACAYAFPEVLVTLSDISKDALAVAQRNVAEHQLNHRVRLIESDLFAGLGGERYDIIVSNPPYVSEDEMQDLATEYDHEPRLGLVAGEQGLDSVIQILQQALDYLTPQGLLIVEVGNSQYSLAEAFPELPFTWLNFEQGGDGVFLLTAQQLAQHFDGLGG